jgi:hypothetical protein
MPDSVRGIVTNIVGRDVFEIKVLDAGKFNENKYKNSECIRIAGINDPELYPGKQDACPMEKLKNREVRCFIVAMDTEGNAVAVVQCIN